MTGIPNKKILLSVCVITALALTFPFFTSAQNTSVLENELRQLEQERREIEKQIEEYSQELGHRHEEIASLEGQIAVINAQINKLDAEIARTQNQIAITRLNIQETQEEIDQATAKIQKNRANIAGLMRSLYIMDGETIIERLLVYNTLSEALNQVQYLGTIHEQLTAVLADTKQARADLEAHEKTLVQNRDALESKNRQLAIQKQAQSTQKSRKDTLLNQTEAEAQQYQQLLTQAQQERAEYFRRAAEIEEQIRIQENFLTYFQAGEIPPPGTQLFIWPEDNYRLTQRFGHTAFARSGAYGGQGHNGIDLVAGFGAEIKAAAGGTVAAKGSQVCYNAGSPNYVRSCNAYWGNWVAIEHPGGLVTLYSHMFEPSLKSVGQEISAGEVIGYEGASGNVTGSHLHFSVYTEFFTYPCTNPAFGSVCFPYAFDKTIDPMDYL